MPGARQLLVARAAFAALTVFAILALPSLAAAETPSGKPLVTIPVGVKGKGLRAGGGKVTAFGGGLVRDNAVALQITDVSVAGTSTVNLVARGGIRVKLRGRTTTLRGFFIKVSGRKFTVTAKIGRNRLVISSGRLSKPAEIDAARFAVKFAANRTFLSKGAVRAIRAKLRSFKPRSRSLGRLAGSAFVVPAAQSGAVENPATASTCKPVSSGSNDPGKPGTAVDISCGYLLLHTRDSWTSYVELNTPIAPGAGLPAYAGTDHVCKDGGVDVVDVYTYSLPVNSGWWDAASGRGYLKSNGGVHYESAERGINVNLYDFEVVIDGASSATYAVVTESDDPTPKRIKFATINPAAPMAGALPGPGVPLTRLRQILTVEAIGGPFGWMYSEGSGFGCVDFGFNF